MKKIKLKQIIRIILAVLIVINCITIFKFSAEQAEKSSNTSGKVIDTIVETNPKTKNLSKAEKDKVKEQIVTPVRKTGHFTIYTIMGMLLFLFAKTFDTDNKRRVLGSLLFAFLYACTDEVHQMFVAGRSCEFRDVCIDSLGALFGIGLMIFAVWVVVKIKNLHKVKNDSEK